MGKRYLSLDFLRGVSIFGMIFSAIIPYGVLPAWMYHIQNPPPEHTLDMSVSGIGWVDLVFPVFIFCMGAAIPLGWKKLEGQRVSGSGSSSTQEYIKGVVTRFLGLWAFSYLYVLMNFSNVEGLWPQIFTLAGFGALFLIYSRDRSFTFWGILLAVIVIAVGHFYFGEVVSQHRRGIIIFLLAFLYLFGSLIWYFTRDNLGIRAVIFAVLFIFTHVTRQLDWPAITYANPSVRWWFNMEYFYFLLILLPATVVGDMLRAGRMICERESGALDQAGDTAVKEHIFYPALLLFTVWQCYALYMNITEVNLLVSLLFFLSLFSAANRYFRQYRSLIIMAGVLMLWGLLFTYIEGGVKKVPCTVSYCMITSSIAICLLIFSGYICKYAAESHLVRLFAGAGRNPLMGYVAFDLLVVPFMKATGIIAIYSSIYSVSQGNPLWGIVRAAAVTLLTMWIVALFSRKKIFWKA